MILTPSIDRYLLVACGCKERFVRCNVTDEIGFDLESLLSSCGEDVG